MTTIAHIVNPVVVDETSDLFIAQPITFETMAIAQRFARNAVDVDLFTAQYAEDRPLVPDSFEATPDLTRSVLDLGTFRQARKLPLLRDILDRLYEASEAEYFIYTNVDIALQPHFYVAVRKLIRAGHDAFVINRRTISDRFTSVEEIPQMYVEAGQPHPGHDCFVFRRDAYPQYKLGNVCVGINWVGWILIQNLAWHAQKFREFTDRHLTFHIGDRHVWADRRYGDYIFHNKREAYRCISLLTKGEN